TPGMVNMVLDPRGNLLFAATVPLQKRASESAAREVDWTRFIELAGFDPTGLEETSPEWAPPVPTTRRFAWNGTFPTRPDIPLRIEAASWEGRPIWFEVFPPWQKPLTPHVAERSILAKSADIIFVLLFASTLLLAAFLARRNVVRGRSDRKNAFRLAMAGLVVMTVAQIADSDMIASSRVVPTIVTILLRDSIGFAAFLWLSYLALEPYLRRRWPRTLISSTRLLSGRLSDPRVGRDIFIGVLAGLLMQNLWPIIRFAAAATGVPMAPHTVDFNAAGNLASAVSLIVGQGIGAIWYPLFVVLVLLLAHLVLRNRVAAIGFTIVAFALFGDFAEGLEWLLFGAALVAVSISVLTIVRWGLLAGTAATYTIGVFHEAPLLIDPSSWLFPYTLLFLLPLVVLIGAGFFLALGKQPLFADAVLEG
ncbi:MAG TPA: hypothetical protein VMT00_16420, partial [Thermoanaerobaculia bacterium]|nr:hypothetical protein [Thermoanaerobaculia bacterium]